MKISKILSLIWFGRHQIFFFDQISNLLPLIPLVALKTLSYICFGGFIIQKSSFSPFSVNFCGYGQKCPVHDTHTLLQDTLMFEMTLSCSDVFQWTKFYAFHPSSDGYYA